jgi:hypothetical protein
MVEAENYARPAIALHSLLHGLMIPPPRFGDGEIKKMLGTKFVPLNFGVTTGSFAISGNASQQY